MNRTFGQLCFWIKEKCIKSQRSGSPVRAVRDLNNITCLCLFLTQRGMRTTFMARIAATMEPETVELSCQAPPKLLTSSSGIQSPVLLGCQDLEFLYLSGAFIFIMLIITQILTRRSLNRMIIRNESSQQSNIDHGFTRTCE